MPAKMVARPKSRQQLQTGTLVNNDPAATSRQLSDLTTAVDRLEVRTVDRTQLTVDLVAGTNTVNHGLGRKVRGMTLTPTVADVTFAWALTGSDEKQATISVLNVAQPRCPVEFY